jgi:GNAT superfamily N-acetyltransferase
MMANAASTIEQCEALLNNPANAVWAAFEQGEAMGYLRFESASEGAASVVEDAGTVACTGAYVRPQYRGRGLAPALLDAALYDFAAQCYLRCSVDFESFNPTAFAFWMKYFTPACISVMRVPEKAK